jgi:CubicO group peptidase (beta-lactamase class C family)
MRRLFALSLLVLAACQQKSVGTAPPPPAPEIGYAWVTFGPNGMRASGASGLADRAQGRPITIDDPVRIASVSKLVVALGVMRLVEQGRLKLDEDVSKLLEWEVRNPRFSQTPITLRLLLSHRSSLKDDNEAYVIPLGKTIRGALSDPAAFDPEHAPGTYFRYSNLNFPVIASVMERASGERFDRLMERLILKPMALDACFNWTTCSQAKVDRGIALYNSDGSFRKDRLEERQARYQVNSLSPQCDVGSYALGSNGAIFSPQGGLRISARDLAKIGQLLLNRGRHDGKALLSEASVEAVMKPAWRYNGSNGDTSDGFYCGYGLATQSLPTPVSGCRDDLFGNGRQVVGHAGEAYGVLSGLWIDPRRRTGIAYFSTNNPREPVPGKGSYRAVEEWLADKLRD